MKLRALLLFLPVAAMAGQALSASPEIFTSVCDDPAGGQRLYLQEKIDGGRHVALDVAKVDMLPGEGVGRLLVFSAVPGRIEEGDTHVSSDLVLVFASDATQYDLIAKASILVATEGETGPIIEHFRFHHDDGRILPIVEAADTLECQAQ